jgi:hypothetical protein
MLNAGLRYLRRARPGGAIEYVAQFIGGLLHPERLRSGHPRGGTRATGTVGRWNDELGYRGTAPNYC